MGAIGGIYSRAWAPLEHDALEQLSQALEPLGPDGTTWASSGPVSMVFRAFHTTQEQRCTPQLARTNDGYLFAFNGRLDNRPALLREFADGEPVGTSTLEIVERAYRRKGREALGRLIGDFALAIWDHQSRALILATDAFGIRPIYYHAGRDFLVWASRAARF